MGEVLRQSYGPLCDLWSCGVILYCLLCGYLPFDGETPRHVAKSVRKCNYSLDGELWGTVSADAKNLIRSLLVKDTQVRFSAAQVLEHNWILATPTARHDSPSQKVAENLRKFVQEAKWAR